MSATILIGPYTYVLDNEDAQTIAQAAAKAYKERKYDLSYQLKMIAARVEEGKISSEDGAAEAEAILAA